MIEIEILPDGRSELPVEARDHGVLATHLEAGNPDVEPNNSVVIDWREVERNVSRRRIVLRAPGTLDEYNSTAIDAISNAILNNVDGVKAHPDGWREVEP